MKMKQLWEVGYFVRGLRTRMRFGELSRASLRLLRLQLRDKGADCEWMARPADEWDETLSANLRERHASLQALKDAIAVRELLFCALPEVETANIRVYRQAVREPPELIIAGTVTREDGVPSNIGSLVMQAKLCGLRFWMNDGVLETLGLEEHAIANP